MSTETTNEEDTTQTITEPTEAPLSIASTEKTTETPPESADPGTQADWKTALADDIKNDPSMAYIKDIAGLAKSYVNAQKQVGSDKIVVPGKFSTPEDWEQIYTKLGRPESADQYDVVVPDGGNKEFASTFKEKSHQLGLLPEQVKGLFEWYNKTSDTASTELTEQTTTRITQEGTTLKQSWGNAADKNLTIAKTAVVEMQKSVPGLEKLIEQVGTEPAFIDLMFQFGKNFMEDEIGNNEAVNQFATMGVDNAKERLSEIQINPAYYDKKHPQHKQIVQEAFKLNTLVYGDKPTGRVPVSAAM